ncbi:MAG: TIGR01244 family sulfur transferase [Rhodobacteraceae bacterium]|nr:TIGR01244 family sulfur transferase [Paracoccaceae bacterium]
MDVRKLTETYAVAPQITVDDIPALAKAGFTHVICNRPDDEVTPDFQADALRAATEAAGLTFVYNPVSGTGMTPENVAAQAETLAIENATVLAYCRSGTRSAFVWGLANATTLSPDTILSAAAAAGYDLSSLLPYLEAQT